MWRWVTEIERPEADDCVVGMGLEQLRGCPAELGRGHAGGVERREHRHRVLAHCGLDQMWLAQLWFAQSGFDLRGGLIDAAGAAGAA